MSTIHRMKINEVQPVFVEFIPEKILPGKLYISVTHGTAVHNCCCGCGEEVVTPLSPAEWQLSRSTFGVSLYPSIGNWDYACRSHYFITSNRVVWCGGMSSKQIEMVKLHDNLALQRYILQKNKVQAENEQLNENYGGFIFLGKTARKVMRWLKLLFAHYLK